MIDLTIEDNIARVVLNAPEKRNSLDLSALRELAAAYTEAENAGVRALLLTGAGRVFCAGRDISGVDPATDDAEGYLSGTLEPLMRQMSSFPAPTFAAVQGACLGVGLGLAIATDVVYVAQDAKIGSPFANLGAILDSGGHALFTERLGAHRTLDLIYTSEMMTGAEAVAAGLFSRAVPAEELVEFTEKRMVHASRGATQAFVASKKLVAQIRDQRIGLWKSMAAENAAQTALCATSDYREGFKAFQEKRKPKFSGRG